MDAPEAINVNIRWMIHSDMVEVLCIENDSFDFPWSDMEFMRRMRKRTVIGFVAESDNRVVGFLIYELHRWRIDLLNFAVAPEFHKRGVGRRMLSMLVGKLSMKRRRMISVVIEEQNLRALLFFKSQGFRSNRIISGHYEETDTDAIVMEYRIA